MSSVSNICFVFALLILPSSSYFCINPSPVKQGLRMNKCASPLFGHKVHSNNGLFPLKPSDERIAVGKAFDQDQSSISIHKDGTNTLERMPSSWNNILKPKPLKRALRMCLATVFAFCILLLLPLENASAVPSGGRMGGSFGGSSRESSAPSRIYSSPSTSRQYLYSRPSVTINPSPWYGYSPFYPAPFFPSPFYRPGLTVVTRGPNIFGLLMFFVVGLASIGFMSSFQTTGMRDHPFTRTLGPGVTVSQITVAMHVPEKESSNSILQFLNRLSTMSNTDSRVGVSNLVNEVALELLRQKRSIFAASSTSSHFRDEEKADRQFNSLSVRERSKFDNENVSKFGGVDYSTKERMRLPEVKDFSSKATEAVITLIICINGDSTKTPRVRNTIELEAALTKIATDVKVRDSLRSAEVLWTPNDEMDILNERDVFADYPTLTRI